MKSTLEAYRLFHNGSLALAVAETEGIRIDTDYLERISKRIEEKAKRLQQRLREDDVYEVWRREFGSNTNLGSLVQLAHVVFTKLGYKCPGYTYSSYNLDGTLKPNARPRADEDAFENVDLPFVKRYIRWSKLKKLKSTFLDGISKEVVDGYCHPFFHLTGSSEDEKGGAITQRGSSSNPNFKNFPSRDAYSSKVVRRAFIPREDCVLVENDFSAHEFKIAAAFWQDPNMIAYASDPTKDIHRDMASKCYCTKKEEVSKDMRYCGKNDFVFPRLYGSYYLKIAEHLWLDIDKRKLTTKNGTPVKEVLARKGITELGELDTQAEIQENWFTGHIKKVEDWFLAQFPVFAAKSNEWYEKYKKNGGFLLTTGFWISGVYSKNFVMNCPIQGPAYHCLLWVFTRLRKILRKRGMKTKLIGDIHDCIFADVPRNELQSYLSLVRHLVAVELPNAWKWLCVPLEIEAEICWPTWWHKEKWTEKNGIWGPAA